MENINKQALCVTKEDVIKLRWQSLLGQREEWGASEVTFICVASVKKTEEKEIVN